jgi:hypothetical protein
MLLEAFPGAGLADHDQRRLSIVEELPEFVYVMAGHASREMTDQASGTGTDDRRPDS